MTGTRCATLRTGRSDPFSKRPISVRAAAAAITAYKRSTGDVAGTVDLMLTVVEAGTMQAADLRYGDDAYFGALILRLNTVAKAFNSLPEAVHHNTLARLERIRSRAKHIGWGYDDFVDDMAPRRNGAARRGRDLAPPSAEGGQYVSREAPRIPRRCTDGSPSGVDQAAARSRRGSQ